MKKSHAAAYESVVQAKAQLEKRYVSLRLLWAFWLEG